MVALDHSLPILDFLLKVPTPKGDNCYLLSFQFLPYDISDRPVGFLFRLGRPSLWFLLREGPKIFGSNINQQLRDRIVSSCDETILVYS